jgi:phosphoenolpyruvate carboxykinase (GTP)
VGTGITVGIDIGTTSVKALAVDADGWRAELPLIDQWFTKIGDALPATLHDELDALKARLSP